MSYPAAELPAGLINIVVYHLACVNAFIYEVAFFVKYGLFLFLLFLFVVETVLFLSDRIKVCHKLTLIVHIGILSTTRFLPNELTFMVFWRALFRIVVNVELFCLYCCVSQRLLLLAAFPVLGRRCPLRHSK